MAVKLEMISLIVRRDKIEEKYPGGWKQYIKDNEVHLGRGIWYDQHLVRASAAMAPGDIEYFVNDWEKLGFESYKEVGGERVWGDDLCVVEGMFGGATAPCDWLEFKISPHAMYVYLRGTEAGEIIGREQMPQYNPEDWK